MESSSSNINGQSYTQQYQENVNRENQQRRTGLKLQEAQTFQQERIQIEGNCKTKLEEALSDYVSIQQAKLQYVTTQATKDNYWGDWLPYIKALTTCALPSISATKVSKDKDFYEWKTSFCKSYKIEKDGHNENLLFRCASL